MPLFNHLQEVKKSVPLPVHQGEEIGVCLTCKFWQVDETRKADQTPKLAVCVQPQLKDYALVVSGSSGCDKWVDYPDVTSDGREYAHRGEVH